MRHFRIVLATPIYPPEVGGPAQYTVEITKHLRAAGHDVMIVAYSSEEGTPEVPAGVRFIKINKSLPLPIRLMQMFSALRRIAKWADVIYVQNAVAAGLPAVLAGKTTKKPVVLKFVGDEAWERATQSGETTATVEEFLANPGKMSLRTQIFRTIQKHTLQQATLVTTPSQYLGDAITAAYELDPARVHTNYNAVYTTSELASLFETVERKPHQICTTVRLVKWKGVDGVLRAFAHIVAVVPDTTLVIAGDGPEAESLHTLAQELHLTEPQVRFLGRISPTDAQRLQRESGVCVLNSSYEGLPHTVLGAFAAETPVVATNIPGTRELFVEGSNALVPQGDETALEQAILRLLQNPGEATEQVAQNSKQLEALFSWHSHLDNLTHFFNTVAPELWSNPKEENIGEPTRKSL